MTRKILSRINHFFMSEIASSHFWYEWRFFSSGRDFFWIPYDHDSVFLWRQFKLSIWWDWFYLILFQYMRYSFNFMTSIIIERNYRWSYFKSLLSSIDLLSIVNSKKITNMIRYYLKWVYYLRRIFFFMTLKVTRISIYDESYSWSYKYQIYIESFSGSSSIFIEIGIRRNRPEHHMIKW